MNDLLDLRPGCWNLHVIPPTHLERLLISFAQLAYRGPLTLLDCGRQYDPTIVGSALDGDEAIADRIKTQHAFIPSEVMNLLHTTPNSRKPVLVLDLLSTFYDDDPKLRWLNFILENIIFHLNRLSRTAGVAVVVYPPPSSSESRQIFNHLRYAAPKVITYEVPLALYQQGSLF